MQLFAQSTISVLKQHIATNRPKHADWQRLIARVDAWCANAVGSERSQIPAQSGGWIHNYICPTHWLPIAYDGDNPQHHCPAGHTVEGAKFDEAWLAWRHRQFADMAREVALAYVVTSEVRYLAEVERVLLAYTAFYANFVGADSAESWMLTARVFNQALTEALWAIPLIHAFDLVSADLDPSIRQQIERDFLRPLGETMAQAQDALIAKNNVKSNYMAWFNAALGCLGYTLNDAALIERAIDGAGGFVKHLEVGVLADGMQYEVTPYYHNFVVLAYVILAEAASANGRDLYAVCNTDGQSILGMCQALTLATLPDGTIADLGDGSYWIDSVYDREIIEVYEIAASHKPQFFSFQTMLTHAYARSQRERDGWAALLFGLPDSQHRVPNTEHASSLLPQAGVAVLHASSQLAAVAPFGAYRDSHSHGDQLSLQVWPFSNDAGCVLYGIPARRDWYQDSYAHNTLIVDGMSPKTFSQAEHTVTEIDGQYVLQLQAVDAFAANVQRTIQVSDGAIEDLLTVSADSEHVYDWLFYVDGQLTLNSHTIQAASQSLGDSVAARHIELTGQVDEVLSAEFTITHNHQSYTLILKGRESFSLLLGTAPGTSWNPTERRHVIIGRTVGTTQRYQTEIQHRS